MQQRRVSAIYRAANAECRRSFFRLSPSDQMRRTTKLQASRPAELLNSARSAGIITLLATGAYVSHSAAYIVTKLRCLRLSRGIIITMRNASFTAFYWPLNNLFLSRLHERCAPGEECARVRVPLRDETSCIHGPKTRNKLQLELPRSLPLPPANNAFIDLSSAANFIIAPRDIRKISP